MPFHVVQSNKRRSICPLETEDQYIICPGMFIYLPYKLNDYTNLLNVSLVDDYEQIKGKPVIITDLDAFTKVYTYSENTDKVFRHYVDRGLNTEKYHDTYVYHTPTTNLKRFGGAAPRKYDDINTILFTDKQVIVITPSLDGTITPEVQFSVGAEVYYTVPDQSDTFAGDITSIEIYEVSGYIEEDLVLIDTLYDDPFPTTYKLPPGYYIFRCIYGVPTINQIYSDSVVNRILEGTSSNKVTNDVVPQGGTTAALSNLVRFSNITRRPTPSDYYVGGTVGQISAFIRYTHIVANDPGQLTTLNKIGGATSTISGYVRINPSGIGTPL